MIDEEMSKKFKDRPKKIKKQHGDKNELNIRLASDRARERR